MSDGFVCARACLTEYQAATQARPTQRPAHWMETEDAVVIARPDVSAHVLAHELGRALPEIYWLCERRHSRGMLPLHP